MTRRRRFDFDARSLLIMGAIYIALGIAVILSHPVMPDLFHTHLALWLRVSLWAGLGSVAVAAGILRDSGHHPWITGAGFAVLFIGPAQRAASFGWAIVFDAIGPHKVNWSYFQQFCLYLLLTLLVAHLAKGDEDAGKSAAAIVAEAGATK